MSKEAELNVKDYLGYNGASESILTPAEIVKELDEYIISQDKAKRAVAIALRNRWRRLKVESEIKEEITPKNIIMIGPTGVGKTEISRRLAKLARAPFVKVDASKFTEVGYVGRDVESIVRDLVEVAYQIVKEEEQEKVLEKAKEQSEERLLDLLLPGSSGTYQEDEDEVLLDDVIYQDEDGIGYDSTWREGYEETDYATEDKTREKLRKLLSEGKLDDKDVEIEIIKQPNTHLQMLGPQGFSEIEGQIKDMFSSMVPKQRELRKVPVKEARKILIQEAQETLINLDKVGERAISRTQEMGIVFIDEIDKVCGAGAHSGKGPDVSREGVQRDLLPLVEGSSVSTKYGMVHTGHVLFVASGAFHFSKPSDLMPEFQGRFPIRVELQSLTPEHFVRILEEPKNALTKQYKALLATEGVEIEFKPEAIEEIARLTAEVNSKTENIGARRLYTVLEKLLEDLSFSAHEHGGEKIVIDKNYVLDKLADIVEDSDLSKYIL